jgi:hypothetical protein
MSAPASIAVRVRKLMADGKPRTATEIADAISASPSKVGDFVRVAREPGRNQELHAIDKGGKARAVRYVTGNGENVTVRPAPATLAAKLRDDELTDDELDARYRSRSNWPAVDVVLLRSIDSMVRMGAV